MIYCLCLRILIEFGTLMSHLLICVHLIKSPKGYQMSQTFYDYISGPFIEFLRKDNVLLPIILFLDGHKPHLTLNLGQFCRENGIVIICLPPNCTHFAQPLDQVYFLLQKIFGLT